MATILWRVLKYVANPSVRWSCSMIEGEYVRLRGLELTDVDVFMKHWNNLDLRNFLADADRGPISRAGEEEWVRNTWKESAEKKGYTFAIETIQDRRMIGGTSLMRIT